jgi:hypothetical protein
MSVLCDRMLWGHYLETIDDRINDPLRAAARSDLAAEDMHWSDSRIIVQ